VKDTVKGILEASERNLDSREILNLAAGKEVTIKDIAVKLCEIAGKDPGEYIRFVKARPGELRRSCGD